MQWHAEAYGRSPFAQIVSRQHISGQASYAQWLLIAQPTCMSVAVEQLSGCSATWMLCFRRSEARLALRLKGSSATPRSTTASWCTGCQRASQKGTSSCSTTAAQQWLSKTYFRIPDQRRHKSNAQSLSERGFRSSREVIRAGWHLRGNF